LLAKLLEYDPSKRLSGIQALLHPYFDELREEGLLFPNGNCLPDVLNFTSFELGENPEPQMLEQLIPDWY
jgi:glycogen synthase kinase 3 beta